LSTDNPCAAAKTPRPPAIFSLRPLWGLTPELEKKPVF